MKKAAGILFAVSSLPSKYGIGCFSKEAYRFVDWLKEAGQTYWQILPMGPTGYGDSPYQSFSTFSGNPYYIDLEVLIQDGLLTRDECRKIDFGDDPESVDYEKLYNGRYILLRKAFERSDVSTRAVIVPLCRRIENGLRIIAFLWRSRITLVAKHGTSGRRISATGSNRH